MGENENVVRYYDNGQKELEIFSHDGGSIEVFSWDKAGRLNKHIISVAHETIERTDAHRTFYKNGQIKREFYTDKRFKMTGSLREWSYDGALKLHEIYDCGHLVETKYPNDKTE